MHMTSAHVGTHAVLLLLLLSFTASPVLAASTPAPVLQNLNLQAARASLAASVSVGSPQVYGGAAIFKCSYADDQGVLIPLANCSVVIDGRHNPAVMGLSAESSYGEILPVGTHSWYCSCFAAGYEKKESSPTQHIVFASQESIEFRDQASAAVTDAKTALAEAKQKGENTVDSEKALSEAEAALLQGNFRLANTLVANDDLLAGHSNTQGRIFDMGLLLVPLLFLGVVFVGLLFIFMRK
ncbi:Uncharacterised protein [Candidatus Burarchaeum australiense]|nr:Uncharacterised protein [Candidatus Burarchaeum australiense]